METGRTYALNGCQNCHYNGLYGIGGSSMPQWYHELGQQASNGSSIKYYVGGALALFGLGYLAWKHFKK